MKNSININSEKVKSFFSKFFNNLLIVIALGLGFAIGYYTYMFKSRERVGKDNNPYHNVKYPQTISVAVNDANEMLIIDRSTGNYQVYSDSVGMMIFKLYAGKIYQNVNEPSK